MDQDSLTKVTTHPALAAGRVAVITGGASGIGLAAAKRFAALGMKVCLADLDPAALDRAAAEINLWAAETRRARGAGMDTDHAAAMVAEIARQLEQGLSPVAVAEQVLAAIRGNELYVFTHFGRGLTRRVSGAL